ncbi:MAG TPA: 1-acyl-sn-glycerol-3-phosphate acyltransferase [Arenimonas sp.]|uniref:1-acyl-sn-glycerol-3-phosphate acyltransferase n=1 Tax=Arenimonas sp. TaxID=1872635 RepID=UPI002BE7BED6|nr:1-acyl-sn-glycerol-3-phosphate acyltransferase [Arenimonas sp.]HMB55890.1 1-acyl-sn-glycerol-3-phosphate acyltransferase [Arenimonas sp.]
MRIVPDLPTNAPRSGGNAFSRWLGRSVLRLGGWRVIGEWPDVPRVVVIVAPHSSAWDAIWGIAAKVALGLGIVFIGKKEIFRGPLGWALRKFGGRPVDRSAPGGIVDQVAQQLRESERMWFVLAPEGTRRKVTRWKSGFWKIAKRADVPVFCAWFHYPDRVIGLGPMVELSDDMEADLVRIRQMFADHHGKNRGAV